MSENPVVGALQRILGQVGSGASDIIVANTRLGHIQRLVFEALPLAEAQARVVEAARETFQSCGVIGLGGVGEVDAVLGTPGAFEGLRDAVAALDQLEEK